MESDAQKTTSQIEDAEAQIRDLQRVVDYQIREYPIEVVVDKFIKGEDEGTNEIFVPDYQRDLVWSDSHQSKFIESLLIGLPIPYLFVADVSNDDEQFAGRLEIIDGTQRIRTLVRFVSNELKLANLKKLTSLNGFCFKDLLPSRQRRFSRITLRLIELTEQASEETRRDMFERINSGSIRLNPMENRRGTHAGPFVNLVQELAKDQRFIKLAPLTDTEVKRFDREELVCRFFAFYDKLDSYGEKEIGNRVADFVDAYVKEMNEALSAEDGDEQMTRLKTLWDNLLAFADNNYKKGFAKAPQSKTTPRVRFDAIAVGTALALKDNPSLLTKKDPNTNWLDDEEFKRLTTSDAANNRARVLSRISYVRNGLGE